VINQESEAGRREGDLGWDGPVLGWDFAASFAGWEKAVLVEFFPPINNIAEEREKFTVFGAGAKRLCRLFCREIFERRARPHGGCGIGLFAVKGKVFVI